MNPGPGLVLCLRNAHLSSTDDSHHHAPTAVGCPCFSTTKRPMSRHSVARKPSNTGQTDHFEVAVLQPPVIYNTAGVLVPVFFYPLLGVLHHRSSETAKSPMMPPYKKSATSRGHMPLVLTPRASVRTGCTA